MPYLTSLSFSVGLAGSVPEMLVFDVTTKIEFLEQDLNKEWHLYVAAFDTHAGARQIQVSATSPGAPLAVSIPRYDPDTVLRSVGYALTTPNAPSEITVRQQLGHPDVPGSAAMSFAVSTAIISDSGPFLLTAPAQMLP